MKIFYRNVNKKKISLCVWIFYLVPSLYSSSVYGAQNIGLSPSDLVLVTVNLQRILEQMKLVQTSLTNEDNTRAFEHAYISHSIIFPSIKDKLKEIDQNSTDRLESLLIDLPIMVRSSTQMSEIGTNIIQIKDILNDINSAILNPNSSGYNSTISSTIIVLLNDTSKFYQLSDFGNSKNPSSLVDYENAIGTADISHMLYKNISKVFDDYKQKELESFFDDLKNSLLSKSDIQSITVLIKALQTNLAENESDTQSNDSLRPYFANIKNL